MLKELLLKERERVASFLLAELDKETPGRRPGVDIEEREEDTEARHPQLLQPLHRHLLGALQVRLHLLHEVQRLLLEVGVVRQVVAHSVEGGVGQRVLQVVGPANTSGGLAGSLVGLPLEERPQQCHH